jgi:hypothetical protein
MRAQVLMAAILSSQTRDEVTHAAMLRLPAHGCTSAHLLEVLKELLKPVSFCARKAEYVQNTSTILLAQYGGDIPSTLNKELLALPGVGPNLHRSPLETAIHTCAPRHTCTSTVLCWAPQYTTEVARSEGAVELWHLNRCGGTVLDWVCVCTVPQGAQVRASGGALVALCTSALLDCRGRRENRWKWQPSSLLTRVWVCGLQATLYILKDALAHP